MTKKIKKAGDLGISHTMVSHDALYVIEKLQKSSFDGYIVGGGVRDLLLGKTPKDFDIVTNASPEQVRKIFRNNSIIIGRRFKIVHVLFNNINPEKMVNNRPIIERNVIEISTYRSFKVHKHHINEHGKITEDNNYGTQEEDAFRRDFTINSLYYDPIKEIVIDYTNGIKDVQNKLIRVIGNVKERYTEDPVRMLRAFRLAVKLDLQIEKHAYAPFNKMKHLLTHENKWRLYEEMLKILLSGSSALCIQKLQEIKLPHNVFTLFDKLFFCSTPDTFAIRVLEKTDLRLKETTDISVIFILAGLLWPIIHKSWTKHLTSGVSAYNGLLESITYHEDFIFSVGITKNIFCAMREIWMLQLKLEAPQVSILAKMTTMPRFRQAWHLYCLRQEFNQIDNQLYEWWNKYIAATSEQQMALVEELKILIPNQPLDKPKRKKKRKKKSSIATKHIPSTDDAT